MTMYELLTAEGKDAYLQALDEVEWFSFDQNSREEISKRLEAKEDPKDYVTVLFNLWFDAEGFEDDLAYNNLLGEILKVSALEICEKKVAYHQNTNSVSITLTTRNNTYNYQIAITRDWIDESFIDHFINERLLGGEQVESRFFALPFFDQTARFVFIPKYIYDNAVKEGIIPDRLNYFMPEDNE